MPRILWRIEVQFQTDAYFPEETGSIEHRHFTDILDYLNKGDCLVINDTKVIPARLYGHKEETGALIEILLLKRRENDIWEMSGQAW